MLSGIILTEVVFSGAESAGSGAAPLLAQSSSSLMGFLPLILIMVIFYLLLILPAQKRQKKTAQMQKSLKNGDKVLTSGGVYGTVTGLEEDVILLRVAEQVKIRVARSAIAEIMSPESKESS